MRRDLFVPFTWYARDGSVLCSGSLRSNMPEWTERMNKVEALLRDSDYKRVAQTTLKDGRWVSTVWIGLDHNFGCSGERPLIFETMIFPADRFDSMRRRWTTEQEALVGHEWIVRALSITDYPRYSRRRKKQAFKRLSAGWRAGRKTLRRWMREEKQREAAKAVAARRAAMHVVMQVEEG